MPPAAWPPCGAETSPALYQVHFATFGAATDKWSNVRKPLINGNLNLAEKKPHKGVHI